MLNWLSACAIDCTHDSITLDMAFFCQLAVLARRAKVSLFKARHKHYLLELHILVFDEVVARYKSDGDVTVRPLWKELCWMS